MPVDDRSGWILDLPSFIRTNVKPAPRSFDMDNFDVMLPIKPSRRVLELTPAKDRTDELLQHETEYAIAQHDEVAHTRAISDFSLMQVGKPCFLFNRGL
jgi:hypothetical protein